MRIISGKDTKTALLVLALVVLAQIKDFIH